MLCRRRYKKAVLQFCCDAAVFRLVADLSFRPGEWGLGQEQAWVMGNGLNGLATSEESYFLVLVSVALAAIFAKPNTIPELVITASGHRFSAAFFRRLKSSGFIFTFT